jgi:DNA-binding NarL/FixJ family response regulator
MIKLLIFENDRQFLKTLKTVFKNADDIELVAAYPEANSARLRILEHQPDVVLMDIQMSGIDGINATSKLKNDPTIAVMPKIVIMTVMKEGEQVSLAIRAGADGYLLKSSSVDEYLEKVREVCQGEGPVMTNEVGKLMFGLLRNQPESKFPPRHFDLSMRERQILCRLAKGKSSPEIADELFISVHTVHTHLKHIYEKTGTRSQIEAVNLARDYQLCNGE